MVPTLTVDNIVKRFGETAAVGGVSFSIASTDVVALAGGNGSGKTTLLRIIAGALMPDSGSVIWEGQPLRCGNSRDTRNRGIEMVFQDCALCPDATVVDNLFLGREPISALGFLKLRQMQDEAQQMIERYHLPIPSLTTQTRYLSGGQQKAVAIGRALLSKPRLLLLDEPTAALGVKEQKIILNTLIELRSAGVGIILCTHSPDEILLVAQRVLALRRGELVHNKPIGELSRNELALVMST